MGDHSIDRRQAEQEQDRGLAIERTALAWTRSALALAVIAALAVRRGTQGDLPEVAYPIGVVLFGGALAVWFYGEAVYRSRVGVAGGIDPRPRARAFRAMAMGTVAVAAVAVVLAVPS